MNYVLDACAMIAYLGGEPGADVVEQALLEKESTCFAHGINLCEVFYAYYRAAGSDRADEVLADLAAVGITERSDFDGQFWRTAGRIKADHRRVSLADCCAIALANRTEGVLLTSDHHELDAISAHGVCSIQFIR